MAQPQPSFPLFLLRGVLVALAVTVLAACASSPDAGRQRTRTAETNDGDEENFDTRLSRLKLGMSRSQVIAIMGDNYTPGGRSQTAQGSLETLRYEPGFGSRYATALIRGYSMGVAGRRRTNGTALQLTNGRLSSINQF